MMPAQGPVLPCAQPPDFCLHIKTHPFLLGHLSAGLREKNGANGSCTAGKMLAAMVLAGERVRSFRHVLRLPTETVGKEEKAGEGGNREIQP